MAKIIGGIGASHSPTIGFARDTNKQDDPDWKPIFEGFGQIQKWLKEKNRISYDIYTTTTSHPSISNIVQLLLSVWTIPANRQTKGVALVTCLQSKAIPVLPGISQPRWLPMNLTCLSFKRKSWIMAVFLPFP